MDSGSVKTRGFPLVGACLLLVGVLFLCVIVRNSVKPTASWVARARSENGAFVQTSNDESAEDFKAESENSGEHSSNRGAAENHSAQNDAVDDAAENLLSTEFQPDQLIAIGSLAEASNSRFLVTINRRGGTIRRIELNERARKNRLRYRDVDSAHGYLGHLELSSHFGGGCRVNLVGPGTPADLAGIKPGDVMFELNDLPIDSPDDLPAALQQTKPGQTIRALIGSVSGKRSQIDIDLIAKPLEVVRPEPYLEFVDRDTKKKMPAPAESMLLSFVDPRGVVWKPMPGVEQLRDNLWEVVQQEVESVVLAKTLQFENGSSLEVQKTYSLPQLPPDLAHDHLFHRAYHVQMGLRFLFRSGSQREPSSDNPDSDGNSSLENHGTDDEPEMEDAAPAAKTMTLAYQLYGPTGTPVDGWWYQNKISGNNSSFFSTAGARDIVSQTRGSGYQFLGGPQIARNFGKDDPKNMSVFSTTNPGDGQARYLGVDTQYFSVMLLPGETVSASGAGSEGDGALEDDGASPSDEDGSEQKYIDSYSAYAWLPSGIRNLPEKKYENRALDMSFTMFSNPIVLTDGEPYSVNFDVFAGPKAPKLLDQYELGSLRSFGWFGFISRPLGWLLRMFYYGFSAIGLPSYGLAIILLTVIVRSAMIPISRQAALNAQKMQALAPEIKKIAEKHKDNPQARMKAQQDLFRSNNYKPTIGCLLMFLQLPIFMGLYRALSVDIALRDQPLIHGLSWCSNLAGPDKLFNWSSWMPGFLASESGWLGPYFNVLPCITVVLFLIQQKLFTPPPTDEQQEMMQKMMKYMMIFMGVMFFKVPAGLCLYFISSSIWGIVERKILPKPQLKEGFGSELPTDPSGRLSERRKKRRGEKATAGPVVGHRESDVNKKARDKKRRDRQRQLRDR